MDVSPRVFRKLFVMALMLLVMAAYSVTSVSAETTFGFSAGSYADGCVIPESGPWPPCATGGASSGDSTASGDACPATGKWPPGCVPGGSGSGGGAASAPGQACPASGPWPPGCVPGGSGGGAASGGNDGCVIPASGPWPPCASAGGGGGGAQGSSSLEWRINNAVNQLQTYWGGELSWRGIANPQLKHFEVYEGDPGDPPNAFYIPAEDAIYVDSRLLDIYVAEFGEYAAVAVIAHEWGHFVQDALGLLVRSTPTRTIELQADCLTGSFTGYLRSIGALRPGEFEAGGNAMFASGDDQLSDLPVSIFVQHGTGEERRASYEMGYYGSAQTCFEALY